MTRRKGKLIREPKLWLSLQAAALMGGNYIGWSAIAAEVQQYCQSELGGYSALLDFGGTVTTNPLLTPCFWGSISFVISLVWTLRLLLTGDRAKISREHGRLIWLLAASVLFALINNIPVFYRFYTQPPGKAYGCSSGAIIDNPFVTACFLGLCAFAVALVMAIIARKSMKRR